MNIDTRVGGDGEVRLEALTHRYTVAQNEAELETALADELRAQRWIVERQVWCRPMDDNRFRRIDVHASGHGYSWSEVHPLTLGLELKFDSGLKSTREAMNQIRRYRQASVWCDSKAEPMVAPVWFLFTNRALLGADGRFRPPGPLLDRLLWEMGASVLQRKPDGNLWTSVRLPKLIRRGEDRTVLTTRDVPIRLTRWNTGRRPWAG